MPSQVAAQHSVETVRRPLVWVREGGEEEGGVEGEKLRREEWNGDSPSLVSTSSATGVRVASETE